MYINNITCDKDRVNEMKVHMLMLMNAWMMLVLMKCKCQMQFLTLGCYSPSPYRNLIRDLKDLPFFIKGEIDLT